MKNHSLANTRLARLFLLAIVCWVVIFLFSHNANPMQSQPAKNYAFTNQMLAKNCLSLLGKLKTNGKVFLVNSDGKNAVIKPSAVSKLNIASDSFWKGRAF